jgi:hypothetical protein
MRRSVAAIASAAIVFAGAAGCLTAGAGAAAPPAPLALPPDLQRLEQAMLALQVTSERFTASISVTGSGTPGGPFGNFTPTARAALVAQIITLAGEQSFAPPLASVQANVLGIKLNERLIGTTLYLEEPFISSFDGGRPWVVEPNQKLEGTGGTENELGAPAGGASARTFAREAETLARARAVSELGPRTVDGQATTAFAFTVDLTAYSDSAKQRDELAKLVKPLGRLELFLAEDGLPVRSVLSLAVREKHPVHHAELVVQADILAINIPVVVVPPPANQTITQSRLERLEAAQLRRLLRRLRGHVEGPRFTG